MDYDDDGIEDFISGSYDPGDVYLFRGLGDGEYAEGKSLVDENDVPLVHHSAEMAKYQSYVAEKESETSRDYKEAMQARVASFGSWAAMVDWDDDGDLDMLIGTFMGKLFLRTNIGSRSNPAYAADSQQVESDGSPLKKDSHTNPVVADWDGDGLWDLVVGAGNGSVSWYRNLGTKKQPQILGPITKLQDKFAELYEEEPEAAKASGVENKLEAHYEEIKPIGTAIEKYFGGEPWYASFIRLYSWKSIQ